MNALVCDQANFSSSLCLSIFWFYGLCYSCDLKLHIWWRATQILHWHREKRTTNHKEEDNFLSFIYQPCFMEVRRFQFRELLSSLPGGNWQIQKKRRNWSAFYRTLNYWWCIWLPNMIDIEVLTHCNSSFTFSKSSDKCFWSCSI